MPLTHSLKDLPEGAGQVERAFFLGGRAVFLHAGGTASFLEKDGTGGLPAASLHEGLLCAATDGRVACTGGEDGLVCLLTAAGDRKVIAELPGKWIDRIAIGPGGVVAAASGRMGVIIEPDGSQQGFACERAMEGLAFAPKGRRLAIARYNGAELRWLSRPDDQQFLEWSGAHTGALFSPDGRYLVTTMQENALHGWRLADMKHMRMSGYPAKVKSLSFSHNGKWLASSGAPAAIVWPFSGKDGPMGKAPKELGSMGGNMVSEVAFHPGEEVLAIGFEHGLVLAVRVADNREAVLREADGSAITSLGWDDTGICLAFGTLEGAAGFVNIAEG